MFVRLLQKKSFAVALACGAISTFAHPHVAHMDSSMHLPSFGKENTRAMSKRDQRKTKITKNSIVLIAGTGHASIAESVSSLIDVPLADAKVEKFNDGECNIDIGTEVRGKHVYIVQSCTAPVNDNVMELLLLISCCRRAGAKRITAVIPYFAYKHHRRFTAVSTKHHSRFLTSGAMDFAKMLEAMEVDSVVSVDIQRPGQGHEACYFSAHVPLECIVTTNLFTNYLSETLNVHTPLVVVAPNAESLQKAKKFQLRLQRSLSEKEEKQQEPQEKQQQSQSSPVVGVNATALATAAASSKSDVRLAGFFQTIQGAASATAKTSQHLELLGNQKVCNRV